MRRGGRIGGVLELQGIAKHFGAIEALKGVDLAIEPRRGRSA